MGPNYIAFAVPLFLLFMGLELWVAARRKNAVYRVGDTLSNLGCGMTQQVFGRFFELGLLGIYTLFWTHWRVVTLPGGWIPWVAAFVGVDFCYYWWHRLSHHVNVLWAIHAVHHQSEDYNLGVALRQAAFSPFTQYAFYMPLAFLGVPPLAFATMAALSTLYQFWIHTELVGKLGPVEYVVNTASQHRVHHAVNPEYLDKNFAATLVIWDQLFGTWRQETSAPVYGVSKPLRSLNPLWAQVQEFHALWKLARKAPSVGQAVQVLFRSPAWHPEWEGPLDNLRVISVERAHKYDPPVDAATVGYVFPQFAIYVGATFALLMWGAKLPLPEAIALTALTLSGLGNTGGLLEKRRWARIFETMRLVAVGGVGSVLGVHHGLTWLVPLSVGFTLVSLVWLHRAGMAQAPKSEAVLAGAD